MVLNQVFPQQEPFRQFLIQVFRYGRLALHLFLLVGLLGPSLPPPVFPLLLVHRVYLFYLLLSILPLPHFQNHLILINISFPHVTRIPHVTLHFLEVFRHNYVILQILLAVLPA